MYFEVPNLHEGRTLHHNNAYKDFYYMMRISLQSVNLRAHDEGRIPRQGVSFNGTTHKPDALASRQSPQITGLTDSDPVLVTAWMSNHRYAMRSTVGLRKVDKEYKALLEKHLVSDQMVFVGKPNV